MTLPGDKKIKTQEFLEHESSFLQYDLAEVWEFAYREKVGLDDTKRDYMRLANNLIEQRQTHINSKRRLIKLRTLRDELVVQLKVFMSCLDDYRATNDFHQLQQRINQFKHPAIQACLGVRTVSAILQRLKASEMQFQAEVDVIDEKIRLTTGNDKLPDNVKQV